MYPTFERSFASHEKHIFWSKKNEKKPRDVFKSSHKKYLFDCDKCGHEFENELNSITIQKQWCNFCSNSKLCNNIDCKTCLDKSFASHKQSIFWSYINKISPRSVFKSSDKKYLFNCDKCGHEFEIKLSYISNNKSWCSYCTSRKLCDKSDCKLCLDKSFASHPRAIFWSEKNENINPRNVFKNSNYKYWFYCGKGHEFETILGSISNMNSWCPFCINKTEAILYDKIIQTYTSIIRQFKQDWCKNKNNNYLSFDFCIPEHKSIIELDGRQHFTQVRNWSSPEEQFENDKYKEKCANDNGYSTIRIVQEDVWNDVYDWCKELCEAIEKIKNGNEIVNIYLCKNNEYEKYKI